MAAMVKTTKESQFKGEIRMNKLHESVDFICARFNELEDNNLKMHDKIAILEK